MIKQYWAVLSSQTYLDEEVDKMKNKIMPGDEFRKKYNLLNIVILRKKLSKGKYELRYGNAVPIQFEIK